MFTEFTLPDRTPTGRNATAIQISPTVTLPVNAYTGAQPHLTIGKDDTVYLAVNWRHATGLRPFFLDAVYAYKSTGELTKLVEGSGFYAAGLGQGYAITEDPASGDLFILAAAYASASTPLPRCLDQGRQGSYVGARPLT